MGRGRFRILVVEDNAGDRRLIQEALESFHPAPKVEWAVDGVEVLERVAGLAISNPHLILLDLNLPKKDGREVLKELKGSDITKRIPVVIFSTSLDESDISSSYAHYANAYVIKPLDLESFFTAVKEICAFWGSIVRLPAS